MSALIEHVVYALEQERENAILEQWQRLYPWMAAGLMQFKPYSEFRQEIMGLTSTV